MRPEKLECLLDSFIASRRNVDTVDAIIDLAGNLAEYEGPMPYGYEHGGQMYDEVQFNSGIGGLIGAGIANHVQAHAQAQAHVHPHPHPVQSAQLAALGSQLVEFAAQFAMNQPDCSIVKFEKLCIVEAPEEHTIFVVVKRSETSANTVTRVTWKTRDRTAISGTHYVGSSGDIVFEVGALEKKIPIRILQSSEDDDVDLRFNVEMSVFDSGFDPKCTTVTLKKLDNFYPDERQVVENLPSQLPFSVDDIQSILSDRLNSRTFYMGLTHLCSAADSVHLEFALAFDLSQACIRHFPRQSILKVLRDFFRMDDIEF